MTTNVDTTDQPERLIKETTDTRQVILKRVNGHFEATNSAIKSYSVGEAADEARKLAEQYYGQTFAVFELVEQVTFKPVAIIEEAK